MQSHSEGDNKATDQLSGLADGLISANEVVNLIRQGADPEKAFHLDTSFRLNDPELTEIDYVGSGSYGTVYLAKFNGQEVALKESTASDDSQFGKAMRQFAAEIKALCSLSKAGDVYHVIKIIGYDMQYTTQPYCLSVVMEYAPGGSLADIIDDWDDALPDWTTRYTVIGGIAKGIEEIHRYGLLHCDIKAGNILITSGWHVKIADFGLSRLNTRNTVMCGSTCYIAPEVFRGAGVSDKSDVYSFAVVAFEVAIWCGADSQFPAWIDTLQDMGNYIISGNRPQMPWSCKPKVAGLVTWAWQPDSNIRPTAPELCAELNSDIDTVSDRLRPYVPNR